MKKIYSLCKEWKFAKDNSSKGDLVYLETKETVTLPHTWNVTGDDRGKYVYEKNLEISDAHKMDKLFLEFLGANSVCKVYLNGVLIGEHRGGYSTFRFEITSNYRWNQENVLRVQVDNSITKDVSPLNGDFTIYGGLYRPVNLICTDKNHFDLCYWGSQGVILQSETTETGDGILHIDTYTLCETEAFVEFQVIDCMGTIIYTEQSPANQISTNINIKSPTLWNGKKNPYLYTLKAVLRDNGTIFDEVSLAFGFRSCKLTTDNGFFLNGKNLKLNGVAKHQDFAERGNGIDNSHIDKDFQLIQEIGANSVRLSHYQHAQYTYELCDKEGYIVWAEIPMLSLPDRKEVLKNAEDQLKELLYQNSHHPSICFWGIQNEIAMDGESIAMYQSVERLNDLVHEIYPGAITASANMYFVKNNSPLNRITDLQGYNHYYGWYYGNIQELDTWLDQFHEENKEVAIGISEYGADCNLNFHSSEPKVKDYSEEFQTLYHEETYPIICSKPYVWGSYVWNMFDFGSSVRNEGGSKGMNCKGLVTFDRNVKKDAFYYYKSVWSEEAFIHICEKRYVNRHLSHLTLKIFSNLDQVSLRVNGIELGEKKGKSVFVFENIELKPGENTIEAYSAGYIDCAKFWKVEEQDTSYRYVDPNPEINVKNWFTQEQGEVDMFPEDSYSILDTIGTLMENEEAWQIICKEAPEIAERSQPGAKVTLLWVANKMKNIYTEQFIRSLNEQLIKIKKTVRKDIL